MVETGESRTRPDTRARHSGGSFLHWSQATCGIDAASRRTKSPSRPHCRTEDVNGLIIAPILLENPLLPYFNVPAAVADRSIMEGMFTRISEFTNRIRSVYWPFLPLPPLWLPTCHGQCPAPLLSHPAGLPCPCREGCRPSVV